MTLNFEKKINKKLFNFWECPGFNAKTSLLKNELNPFSVSVKMLIVTFMREIKPVVLEILHFDFRDELFFITTFWKLWTISDMQRSISVFFLTKCSSSGLGTHLRFWLMNSNLYLLRNVSLNNKTYQYRWHFSDFWEYEDCDTRHTTTIFSK